MIPLKYQTSSQKFILGQFLSTDGNTVASSDTIINSSDVTLIKHNSTSVSYKSTVTEATLTFISSGFWGGIFSSDDADTLGGMRIYVHVSGALLLKEFSRVMTANEYDTFIGNTDILDVNTYSMSSDVISSAQISSGALSSLTFGIAALTSDVFSSGAISTLTISTATWDVGAVANWTETTRTLSSGGAVWSAVTRTLTDYSSCALSTIALDTLWAYTSRTLTGLSSTIPSTGLLDYISNIIWANSTKTLSTTQSFDLTGGITGNITGNLSGSVGSVTDRSSFALSTIAQDTISNVIWANTTRTLSSFSTALYSTTIIDLQSSALWDEVLTAATHNIATSAGRRIRELAGVSIHAGIAAAGSTITITLDAAASTTSHMYNQCLIALTNGGTGSGQCRLITEYDGATKIAIVDRDWEISPDITSEFQIVGFSGVLLTGHGQASAGSTVTITLSAASIAVDDAYKGSMIVITAGSGAGQARLITGYTALTYVATIIPEWTTSPDNTSIYKIIPVGRSIVDSMSTTSIDSIFDAYADSTETIKSAIKLIRAASVGLSSGGGSTQVKFYDASETVARITADVSTESNRTVVVTDLT